jgi:hypothetical protein
MKAPGNAKCTATVLAPQSAVSNHITATAEFPRQGEAVESAAVEGTGEGEAREPDNDGNGASFPD